MRFSVLGVSSLAVGCLAGAVVAASPFEHSPSSDRAANAPLAVPDPAAASPAPTAPITVAAAPEAVPEGVDSSDLGAIETAASAVDRFKGDVAPWLASAPVALSLDDRLIALPDSDSDSLVLLDAETLQSYASIAVGRRPEQLLAMPSGEIAVACRGDREVQIVDVVAQKVARTLATGADPRGLAVSPDGKMLYVAAFGSNEVRAFRTADWSQAWVREVDTMPVAVAVDSAGTGVFVTHLQGGTVSELDPARGTLRARHALAAEKDRIASMATSLVPLADGRVAVPHVTARTKPADVAQVSSTSSYGGSAESDDGNMLVQGTLTIIASGARPIGVDMRVPDGRGRAASMVAATRNPMKNDLAIVDQVGSNIVVADIAGAIASHELEPRLERAATVVPDTTASIETRFAGLGPGAAVYSRNGSKLFVASWLDRTVTMLEKVSLDATTEIRTRIGVFGQVPLDRELARGRMLFHTLTDSVSTLGVTCASCHPDGLEDGRTWMQSFGPRQTPRLAGRLDESGPFNWLGTEDSLAANLHRTIKRLEGTGTSVEDTSALVAYITRGLERPDYEAHGRDLTGEEARGRELFDSPTVGCAGCHEPSTAFTDGLAHDIGTTSKVERDLFKQQTRDGAPVSVNMEDGMPAVAAAERVPAKSIAFDTPSLVGVSQTAPYFHDGSAPTLRAVLTDKNPHDRMGATSKLSPADVDALVSYLETL